MLEAIREPVDLRLRDEGDLRQIADELRAETINAVAVTGGHLGAGLGVVELTVALHYVFDTPRDKLIWDVGHQAYPHKILTGRRDRIKTLRQGGGLSGFTKRAESEYDCFGAAHSSTSISAGLGMAVARDLAGGVNNVIAVIGDGAMSAGMAYEAMNNAGAMNSRLIVILNDNDMSIAPPVGGMSAYLSRITSSRTYLSLREIGKKFAHQFPKFVEQKAERVEEYARGMLSGGTLFEELGFYYVGPVDGHNLDHLLPVLRNVRDAKFGPILIHVVTQKGKGYAPAEASSDRYHGVVKFDVATGKQAKAKANAPSYTKVFGESLVKEAQKDDKIVAITAAMPGGTGVDIFEKAFPNRTFDVGIAEQHAVTMAAADEAELVHMVATQVAYNEGPSALRYPRGDGVGVDMPEVGVPLEIGKGRVVRQGSTVALLSLGTRLQECTKAAEELASFGLSTTVADARFAKPLDTELVLKLAREHEVLITVEEGSVGGFGSMVLQVLTDNDALDGNVKFRSMVLPDTFIDQDSPAAMYAKAGLDAKGIVAKVFDVLGKNVKTMQTETVLRG